MNCGTILLVEDDDSIRTTMRLALELEGYTVAESANGLEGLNTLSKISQPCLIFLDLMMPVMDGWEFANTVKRNESFSKIPIVAVTAYSEKAHVLENVVQVIKKPVDLTVLFQVAKNFCD